jgi:hypothetical protein
MSALDRSQPRRSQLAPRRPALGVVALAALVAFAVSGMQSSSTQGVGRTAGLARALGERGLVVDRAGVLWLDGPPFGLLESTTRRATAVVRAAPGKDEPHDIYLVAARLSPEGVLLGVSGAHNVSETSAVDEQRPVGGEGWFAFVEQPMLSGAAPSRLRLLEIGGPASSERSGWSRRERLQATVSRLQRTGRLDGVRRVTFAVEPAPKELALEVQDGKLAIRADARRATIDPAKPLDAPDWLSAEPTGERRPGNLVTWAVDVVRAEIGDQAMQYIKAIAFSALDVLLSSKEGLTGDTGAEDIAADLGTDSLEAATREIPVDPDIGFPPPPLETWVTPTLPGEGVWNPKDDDPFIHTLPGLPPTFVTSFIRSDRRRVVTRVYVVLWDPRLVQLNMMAGVAEPKSATGATGPGLIPREPAVMRRVAAAMNAGFQALHGEFGMMSDGVIYLPPKPYGATVALQRDGSTGFGTWPNDSRIPGDVLSYRQNMTPMVVDEKFNPYGRTWWGGTPADWEDRTHTVRTGICLTKEGFIAYFYGADISPGALSRAMIQTRCSYGVALDMNAGHSGFEYYKVAPADEFEPLGRHLRRKWEREGDVKYLEGWKFRARRLIGGMGLMNFPRYIQREGRDFFYLTLRSVLPGEPLKSLDGAPAGDGDGAWRVKGLPQHGFPYAVATTSVSLPSGVRAQVLKLDPRMLTTDPSEAVNKAGTPALVALVNPLPTEVSSRSLWFSRGAFTIGSSAMAPGSTPVVSGAAPGELKKARAALGVERDGGMLIYVELQTDEPVASKELVALLDAMKVHDVLLLDARLPIALGGDTDVLGGAVRLPDSPAQQRWLRRPGAGGRRMFPSTPVVPFKEWYPLQARRIRYFKKKKKDEDS